MTAPTEDRVAALEGAAGITGHRLDSIDSRLGELRDSMRSLGGKLDTITRLQEADVRHAEAIAKALEEIAMLRRESKEDAQVSQTRWDAQSQLVNDRWRAHDAHHQQARKQIDDDLHRVDKKLAWLFGVLAAIQIAASVVGMFYIRTLDAMQAVDKALWQDSQDQDKQLHAQDVRIKALEVKP